MTPTTNDAAVMDDDDVIAGLLSEFIKAEELFHGDAACADVPIGPAQKAEDLSPEDSAWVDSCLVADPELSDDGWSALREALLDSLTARSTAFETPTPADDDVMQQDDDEGVEVCEEAETPPIVRGEDRLAPPDDQGVGDGDSTAGDPGDIESPESIFPVWDLETPDDEEEDELIKQLNKVLGGSRRTFMPPSLDDPGTALNEQKVDELVAGMTDLSLKPSRR